MTTSAKIWPLSASGATYLLKATRLMLAAFSISSMPMRIATAFRRVSTAYRPRLNSIALRIRKCTRPSCTRSSASRLAFSPRDHDRADQGHQQDQTGDLKDQDHIRHEGSADLRRRVRRQRSGRHRPGGGEERGDQKPPQRPGRDHAQRYLLVDLPE